MHATFIIQGTHCAACKALIEDIGNSIPGITLCQVDFTSGKTEIRCEDSLSIGKFKNEIESLGIYHIIAPEHELQI